MNVAVIGGNGYLGKHVTTYFGANSFSRKNGFDVTNINDVERLRDYDIIINMSALLDKSGKNSERVFDVNAKGTENIVKILRPEQIFILTSTKEVHSPEEAYGFSKIAAEAYARAYAKEKGFKLGIFRLSTTYAPTEEKGTFVNYFIKAIQNEEEIKLMMKGEQKRDFLYVDDLSRAFQKFINSNIKEGVYEIGGGEENKSTLIDFINLIGKKVNKTPKISFIEGTPKGELHYITDLTKIKKELGWQPLINLSEGLENLL